MGCSREPEPLLNFTLWHCQLIKRHAEQTFFHWFKPAVLRLHILMRGAWFFWKTLACAFMDDSLLTTAKSFNTDNFYNVSHPVHNTQMCLDVTFHNGIWNIECYTIAYAWL